MRNMCVLCLLVACGGNDSSRHIVDGNGSGSGMPEPCAMTITSSKITTMATGTQCGQQLVNQTTVAINFNLMPDANNTVMSEIACTIAPGGVVPQTLHSRSGTAGCNVEVDYSSPVAGSDEWDNTSSGTVDITVTDLDPLGGTIDLSLLDSASAALTVTGTF